MDATIISAPSSTKNKDEKRDPEMHQTAKGKKNWSFGMKLHIGVDAHVGLAHMPPRIDRKADEIRDHEPQIPLCETRASKIGH